MNFFKLLLTLAILVILIGAGFLAYDRIASFPLRTALEQDETIVAGTLVTLNGQPVGRVKTVDTEGGRRIAKIKIQERAAFPELKVGVVRIVGSNDVELVSGLVQERASQLDRDAIVPGLSRLEFLAKKHLDVTRWPTWTLTALAAAAVLILLRRPLARLTS
jgi:hypothetical protein